ncbi:MAG: hypothetical protein QJR09_03425 [Micrococcus sp.]|nr:hypothetical protein [Micrococcus sp.]
MSTAPAESAPLIPSMRWLLFLAAFLVFLAGVELFVFPLRTAEWFAWTVDPPMTAVFLGAAYWSAAVLEVAGARAASWSAARVAVWPVFVFTTLTLVVTLIHLDRFHLSSDHPPLARFATWMWLAIYVLVPVAMLVIGWVQLRARSPAATRGTASPATGTRVTLPLGVRVLLTAVTAVLLVVGVALLVAPVQAAALWPWPLTALTGRAVGAWLVGLGWAAGQAQWSGDARAVRTVGLTAVVFVLLQVIALLRYGQVLAWPGPPAIGYVAVLVAIGVASGWALLSSREPSRRIASGNRT